MQRASFSAAIRWTASVITRERLVVVLAMSLLLMAALRGVFQNVEVKGVGPERFMAMKLQWCQAADVVLAGDSRVYIDVSPTAMSDQWPGRRILNFGFSSTGYSAQYLKSIERILDPQSDRRTIVLGINPYSLTPRSLTKNGFQITRDQQASCWGKAVTQLEGLRSWASPLPMLETLGSIVRGTRVPQLFIESFSDGWQGCMRVPPAPTLLLERGDLETMYKDNQIEGKIVDSLLHQVARWRTEGIAVYGFRPPVYERVGELEDDMSGFNEQAFVCDFEEAGGVWISVDEGEFSARTYDGHHLPREAAVTYSKALGKRIRLFEEH